MKKLFKATLLSAISLLALSGCNKTGSADALVYTSGDLVQKAFGGLGVEWGAYEDTDKLVDGGWDMVIDHMDHLGAARIRLMISYEWFVYDFDNKGNDDKTDDTWKYNYSNKYAQNMLDILEYCQINNIDVAFGAWNVIGDTSGNDVWDMMEEVTSDIRWAKVSADVLNFLVNQRGFTCIKWFVNTNEPNYTGKEGQSKNYNNTYEKWEQGVKNVRKALDDVKLNNIGIIGGDVTAMSGYETYLLNASKNIPNQIGDYGVHIYISRLQIGLGQMGEQIGNLYKQIQENDPRLGDTIQANIWEGGLLDGKTDMDCQQLIATPDYAMRMTDYTVQALANGINGITYWDFDDAMHFVYTPTSMTPKEWGMFSSLADVSSGKQELRPWYHTTSMLCHLFQKGDKVYAKQISDNNMFRTIASLSHDGKKGGIVAVNSGIEDMKKTFRIDEKVEGDKVYVYIFNANDYKLGEDGYIVPNAIVDGSLNDEISINIPKMSAVFISNVRL